MQLQYAPPPADNPLRGLVPYVTADAVERFPHSLEFDYFPLAALMTGPATFCWDSLEESLAVTSGRGCQLVLRVYLEYPGRESALPRFLVEDGLAVTRWSDESNGGGESATPDYSNARLRAALRKFIAAFGAKYDGDPRLGYITAGLLGSWGEWHTYPRSDLWPSKAVQTEVLDAYERSFSRTPVLLRYPAGAEEELHAPNVGRRFGYHDDSFGWATLDTGKDEDSWYFVPSLRSAGALDTWRTHPIGGEIRPELWSTMFTDEPHESAQDFRACVEATHVTWLMDSGLFAREFPLPPARLARALEEVARMGYVLHIAEARIDAATSRLSLVVENRGVAPFYAAWPVELAAYRNGVRVGAAQPEAWRLADVAPGASKRVTWTHTLDSAWRGADLRVRVPNPMAGGRPLRFANREQGAEWLVLPVTAPPAAR